MLEKKTTKQWYDPLIFRFLQDRNVTGKRPNPNCNNEKAYSDECEVCGTQSNPSELIHPRLSLSEATPELKEIDPEMKDKTLYVWPDSLIAPISFTKVALQKLGRDPLEWERFWKDPEEKIYQFLGQDNVYFYVLMQGAMWIGVRGPDTPDYTMTDVYSVFHLMVNGEKMSKSRGNFYSCDELINEMGYGPDQVRYFLSTLSLAEKQSNFDFETFKERNKFLAGPLNAAIEKPIAAVHSKYNGIVPDGKLLEKAEKETMKIVQLYVKNMEKADHITLLVLILRDGYHFILRQRYHPLCDPFIS